MTSQPLLDAEPRPFQLLPSVLPDPLSITDSAGGRTGPDGQSQTASPAAIRRIALDLFQLAARFEAEGAEADPTARVDTHPTPVVVDSDGFRVWVGDRRLDLTHQEFRLLEVLVEHAGRVLSREQLMRQAWDSIWVGTGRTVDVHVRRLRVALGPAAERLSTVRNVGYRFD